MDLNCKNFLRLLKENTEEVPEFIQMLETIQNSSTLENLYTSIDRLNQGKEPINLLDHLSPLEYDLIKRLIQNNSCGIGSIDDLRNSKEVQFNPNEFILDSLQESERQYKKKPFIHSIRTMCSGLIKEESNLAKFYLFLHLNCEKESLNSQTLKEAYQNYLSQQPKGSS